DLGTPRQFDGKSTSGSIDAGQSNYFAFSISQSEISSTAAHSVFLRVVVRRDASLFVAGTPSILGLDPLSRSISLNGAVALYAVDQPGTYLLQVAGATSTDHGSYQLSLDVAGDINADGTVDGLDSQILASALGTLATEQSYVSRADLDADGAI